MIDSGGFSSTGVGLSFPFSFLFVLVMWRSEIQRWIGGLALGQSFSQQESTGSFDCRCGSSIYACCLRVGSWSSLFCTPVLLQSALFGVESARPLLAWLCSSLMIACIHSSFDLLLIWSLWISFIWRESDRASCLNPRDLVEILHSFSSFLGVSTVAILLPRHRKFGLKLFSSVFPKLKLWTACL